MRYKPSVPAAQAWTTLVIKKALNQVRPGSNSSVGLPCRRQMFVVHQLLQPLWYQQSTHEYSSSIIKAPPQSGLCYPSARFHPPLWISSSSRHWKFEKQGGASVFGFFCICVCVCICISVSVYIYIYVSVCRSVFVSVSVFISVSKFLSISVFVSNSLSKYSLS